MRKGRFLAVAMSTSAACSGDKKGRIRATRRFPFRMHMICMKWSSLGLPWRGESCQTSAGSVPGNAKRSHRYPTAGPSLAPGRTHTHLKKHPWGGKNNAGATPLTLSSACLMGWAGGQGLVPCGAAEKEPPRPCVLPCPSVAEAAGQARGDRLKNRHPEMCQGTELRADRHPTSMQTGTICSTQAARMEVVIGS